MTREVESLGQQGRGTRDKNGLPIDAQPFILERGSPLPFRSGEFVSLGPGGPYLHPDFEFDPERRVVIKDGKQIHLTGIETRLMQVFLAHPNRVTPYDYLGKNVWDYSAEGLDGKNTETARAHIKNLKKKLGLPSLIVSVRQSGYKLVDPSKILDGEQAELFEQNSGLGPKKIYRHDLLDFDEENSELTVEGERIHLSLSERKILAILVERRNRVVSYADLSRVLRGDSVVMSDNFIDEGVQRSIRRLRSKIGIRKDSQVIENVRGVGYMLNDSPNPSS